MLKVELMLGSNLTFPARGTLAVQYSPAATTRMERHFALLAAVPRSAASLCWPLPSAPARPHGQECDLQAQRFSCASSYFKWNSQFPVQENIAAFELDLDEDTIQKIDEIHLRIRNPNVTD